ncbi:hypothetical protein H2201_003321 [Coniosporium apollinis]|uniref:YTH domain-containing protein n=1 Tax=Coniosporium apollinis TaxID=61459 RepID=A0ABQ9NW88_9PEZI|nr:hypothetical protein H2201_003321 [Coniosporium apollinis]
MAPPPLPSPKATRPSTDKNGDNNVRQGTKRPSEASLHEQMPADKVQRIDTPRNRYFIIKSWNHENVQISQRDGTWATQPHNVETFVEAFKTCRNVILVFSVNKSMAFQGYARMESVPGTAPEPAWTKNLLWPSSPPFYIRWITIANTRFSRVGHLKNALNENLAVLVGRDGQEIEQNCGAALCELIDEESRRVY